MRRFLLVCACLLVAASCLAGLLGVRKRLESSANVLSEVMDMRESIRASEELDGGMVWINAPLLDNDAGPFGGTKMSGMGRQLGPEGLETFRKTKFVWLDPECGTQDFWWFPYADEEAYPDAD